MQFPCTAWYGFHVGKNEFAFPSARQKDNYRAFIQGRGLLPKDAFAPSLRFFLVSFSISFILCQILQHPTSFFTFILSLPLPRPSRIPRRKFYLAQWDASHSLRFHFFHQHLRDYLTKQRRWLFPYVLSLKRLQNIWRLWVTFHLYLPQECRQWHCQSPVYFQHQSSEAAGVVGFKDTPGRVTANQDNGKAAIRKSLPWVTLLDIIANSRRCARIWTQN